MKITPLFEMYNINLHKLFMPGVVADVPEDVAQEYIAAGNAVPVEEKARDEPFHTLPDYKPENLPEHVPVEPAKPKARRTKKTT